ncbi:MAG: hypothetical protein ACR2FI_03690 [Burkholderiales bacterium]
MPSPVLNCPLKSAHHVSLGASIAVPGLPGWADAATLALSGQHAMAAEDIEHVVRAGSC